MLKFFLLFLLGLCAIVNAVIGRDLPPSNPFEDWKNLTIEGFRPGISVLQLEKRHGKADRVVGQRYIWERGTGKQAFRLAFSREGSLCILSGSRLMLNGQVIAQGDSDYDRGELIKRLSGVTYKPNGYQSGLTKFLGRGQEFEQIGCSVYNASIEGLKFILIVEKRRWDNEKDAIAQFSLVWRPRGNSQSVASSSLE